MVVIVAEHTAGFVYIAGNVIYAYSQDVQGRQTFKEIWNLFC